MAPAFSPQIVGNHHARFGQCYVYVTVLKSTAVTIMSVKVKAEDFIKSKNLYESVISIPMYPDLKNEEVLYIIESINELWIKYSI